MRSDWTTLDSWLFLATLLYILGVAGGLEAGALSFGEWAVHTLGGFAVARAIYQKGALYYGRLLDKHLSLPLFRVRKAPLRDHLRKGGRVA